jgi:hypothetical protein
VTGSTRAVRVFAYTASVDMRKSYNGLEGPERCVRGPVLGRKNFAGCKSVRGTEVAAVFYTLLESAKLVDVEPRDYCALRLRTR